MAVNDKLTSLQYKRIIEVLYYQQQEREIWRRNLFFYFFSSFHQKIQFINFRYFSIQKLFSFEY
jgi:hypothetical protein